MKHFRELLSLLFVLSFCCALSSAQTSSIAVPTVVPPLVNYSGKAVDAQGKTISGIAGVTFAIYKDQYEGAPLWVETQNVTADAEGDYSVQLGAAKPQGLPLDLFSSGEARWLGVRINGGEEQPRVLLLSVPYALKAADAQTLGGLPASAFVLAAPVGGGSVAETSASSSAAAGVEPALAGTGTTDYVPLWTPNGTTLGNSVLFQSGTGSAAKVGVNTTAPASTLDVKGGATVRGTLALPATGTATASAGKDSQAVKLAASAFNSSSSAAVAQTFQLQVEPAGNDTATTSGTLNLLYASGTSTPAETGLTIASNGNITFAPGQTFPGAGGGVSSVGLSAPTSDFTVSGSPVTTSGTLALNWTVAPSFTDVANSIVKRDPNGNFFGSTIIAFGSSGGSAALIGSDSSSDGVGAVQGSSSNGIGVYGFSGSTSNSSNNYGVYGTGPIAVGGAASTSDGIGVFGSSSAGVGVSAFGATGVFSVGSNTGVYGDGYIGVEGFTDSTSGGWGVYGESQGTGVGGGFYNTSTGDALFAENQTKGSYAAFFLGNVDVDGTLYKAGGAFKIDHPLDPANKYLYHSFVESPDMKNIYDGNVTTDGSGLATVTLPDWFEALNRDFRYQLTVIGQFAQAMVADEISNHQFTIKTDKPNVKVSWQITGIRQDAWANANRIPLEESKAPADQGLYLHPELFGAPAEKSIALAHHPMPPKPQKQSPMILKLQKQQATKLKAPTKQ